MPIVVQHGPSPRILGAAGLLGGYGNFQRWQAEQDQRRADRIAEMQMARERMAAGIFGDRQRLAANLFENQQQRNFLEGQTAFRANEQASRDQFMQAQQNQRQQQQILSQQELAEQRAEEEYSQEVNERLQQFDWDPAQDRENRRVQQQIMALQGNSNLDESQRADGIRQLNEHKRCVIGFPKQKKPTQPWFYLEGPNGQPATDLAGKPIQFYNDGRAIRPVMDTEQGAVIEAKAEAEREKAELKKETDTIKADMDAKKAKISMVQDAIKALTTKEKIMGAPDEMTGKAQEVGEKVIMPTAQQIVDYVNMVEQATAAISRSVDQTQMAQPQFGQQGGGLQPIPQGWQPGTPMGPPTPREQTQIGAQFQQTAPQPQPAAQPQAGTGLTSRKTGKQYSRAGLEAAAKKAGITVEQLMVHLQVQ